MSEVRWGAVGFAFGFLTGLLIGLRIGRKLTMRSERPPEKADGLADHTRAQDEPGHPKHHLRSMA